MAHQCWKCKECDEDDKNFAKPLMNRAIIPDSTFLQVCFVSYGKPVCTTRSLCGTCLDDIIIQIADKIKEQRA